MKHILSFCLFLGLGSSLLPAADWPQWRGANRDDISPDKSILNPWPAKGPKQLWLSKEGGLGYSGFSVVGNQLFTMGAQNGGEDVICLDPETGTKKWTSQIDSRVYPNNWGDGPRSTPTVDGDRIYALSANGTLACLTAREGKLVWKKDLVTDLGGELQSWGYTESVLIEGGKVICTPGGSKGTLAALDKMTGEVVWRSTGMTEPAQYSSTIPVTVEGKRQIVQLLTRKVFGVNPENGELLWKSDFSGSTAVIPTPIFKDGYLYVTAGYGVGCRLYKLGGKDPEIVYENNVVVNHHGGVILADGKLYGNSDKGGWKCQDFLTGEEVWRSDAMGKGGIGYSAGHLVCVDEKSGEVALVKASGEGWKEEGRFKLDPQTKQRKPQGRIWVHPVIVNGRLYLRDQELIYCYDVKGK